MIEHVRHAAIDRQQWDQWLARSARPLWYARSNVLDAVAPEWEALVDGERGAIMPLVGRSRYGSRYLYQPLAVQQLGVFAPEPDPGLVGRFLNAIPAHYLHADIYLNNPRVMGAAGIWSFEERADQMVDLNADLEQIRSRFSKNHLRTLRKAQGSTVGPATADQVVQAIIGSAQWRDWRIKEHQRWAMERLLKEAEASGVGHGTWILERGRPLAVAYWVEWDDRVIFLKGVSLPEGRGKGAMHRLIEHAIQRHAGRVHWLDLAGSDDPGLNRFYAGFGASSVLYLRATMHRLPRLLRSVARKIHGR
ncbi:MAG: GNAT family N-acetyltransferase [Flavobacteriales bacterium]|nr:GNAT family N-acetyltransferase [Flavobacteriales bacterium]